MSMDLGMEDQPSSGGSVALCEETLVFWGGSHRKRVHQWADVLCYGRHYAVIVSVDSG